MNYREEIKGANATKQLYLDGIENLISRKQAEAKAKRRKFCKDIFTKQEEIRAEFKKFLGFPLVDCDITGAPSVKEEKISSEDGYSVYRMNIEILDGLYMTGLYFKNDGEDKRPLVIVQHGGLGTPELISGAFGDTTNYNDMLQRVLKYGVDVFAPQLLLWHDKYEVPFDRVNIDARLKRVGSSITALEVFGITRVLDYFEEKDYIFGFGMLGLSYGGLYTLFTSAVDTRIKAAVSCSFFNTRDNYDWPDWCWYGIADKIDDAAIAALTYPRRLHIEVGSNDEIFSPEGAVESYSELCDMCHGVGTDWVSFKVFEGKHELFRNDEPIIEMIKNIKIK